MNKNITHITGINNNNKNDTIIDYNEKKIFDASVINNINSGITMTSIVQNNSNIHDGNEQILTSIENDGNILPIDEKDFSTNNLSKIENNELNFENAKPLKNNIIGSNKRRSARQFIEDSQKVGTDYMNIPKKDKENENVQNKPLIKNKFENNDIKFKEKDFNFQSRRAKPNTNNNTNNKNKQIHLSKLLEDKTIEKKNNNNNNNIGGGFLFGMESRRGHNNNNQNNKNHPVKKVK